MSAAKATTRKRVRATPRVVQFVKPQFLVHEADALQDHLRAVLAGTMSVPDHALLAAALDELTRATGEARDGRR